jgi:hypothetical protein
MTDAELKQERTNNTRIVAELIKKVDDLCPDVGMPPWWFMHINDALKLLGYTKEQVNMRSLVNARGYQS